MAGGSEPCGTNGPKLTGQQLVALAVSAGVPAGERAQIAAAVALAESGGNVGAIGDCDNPKRGCRSYGLWQINSCPHRDERSQVRNNVAALKTAPGNAVAMSVISNRGANFRAWSTYQSGAYKAFLKETAWTGEDQALIPDAASAAADALGLGGPLNLLRKALDPHSWYLVALFVLGVGALVAGAVIIQRDAVAGAAYPKVNP